MPRWPEESTEQRFWHRVTKSDGCWTWDTPDASSGGYGWIKVDHLFLGTQKTNMADAAQKGRCNGPAKSQPGEVNGSSKLSWNAIDKIRSSTQAAVALAFEFDVHVVTIHAIRRGKLWPLENHP
jgi:hypothetical protein